MLVHGIDAEEYMTGLGYSSKLNPTWDFLLHLRDIGRESAGRWLEANFERLGVESSLDISSGFLDPTPSLPQPVARRGLGTAPRPTPREVRPGACDGVGAAA